MSMKLYFPDLLKQGQRRTRRLSEEELDLWREINQHVRPMAPVPHLPKAHPPTRAITPLPPQLEVAYSAAPLAALERRLKQKLLRGRIDLDASLDLHGMRQNEAHAVLVDFLIHAQRRQHRIVLVITGKGAKGSEAEFGESVPGVLRRALPQWLKNADLRGLVIGFEEAGPAHGGGGAFYVRIRRLERAR